MTLHSGATGYERRIYLLDVLALVGRSLAGFFKGARRPFGHWRRREE